VVPDLAVRFYDWVIAFDHVGRRAWLISTGLLCPNGGKSTSWSVPGLPRAVMRTERRFQWRLITSHRADDEAEYRGPGLPALFAFRSSGTIREFDPAAGRVTGRVSVEGGLPLWASL
jgi:hypothetical protein